MPLPETSEGQICACRPLTLLGGPSNAPWPAPVSSVPSATVAWHPGSGPHGEHLPASCRGPGWVPLLGWRWEALTLHWRAGLPARAGRLFPSPPETITLP